ncbi:hypothetical protein SB778_41785, partial [Paraburkholderia sp. SIMBA_050]
MLEIDRGDYSTSVRRAPVLSAVNGGTLIAAGKMRLFSFGNGSSGAEADGAGSRVELHQAEIRTRGIFGTGISAQ